MQLEPVYGPQVYTLRGLNFKLHVTKFQPNLIIVNVDQIVTGEDLPVEKLKQECKDTLIVGLSTMKSKNEVKKLGYDGYLHTIFNAQELQRVFDENGVDIDKLPSADEPIDIPHVDVKKHEEQHREHEESEVPESVQNESEEDSDSTSADSPKVTNSVKPVEQETTLQPESKPEPVKDDQDDAQSTEPVQSEQQSEPDVKPVETVKEAENAGTVNSDKTSNNDSDAQEPDNAPVDNKLQEQQSEPAQSEDDDEGDDAEIDDLMPDMEDLGAEVGLDDSDDDSDNDNNDDTANNTIDDTQPVQPESADNSNQQQDNSQAVQSNQSEQQNTQVDVQNVNNDLNGQPQAAQTAQADRGADNDAENGNNVSNDSETVQNNPAQPKPVQDPSIDQLNNMLNGGNNSDKDDPVMAPTENSPKTPNLGGSDEPKKKKKVITDNWQQTHMSNINVKPHTESDSDDDLKNFTAMLKGKIPTAEDDVMNQANQQGTIN